MGVVGVVMPLQWSEIRDPDGKTCFYSHVVSETPLGQLRIEWKSWKEHDSPTCVLPWEEFVCENDLSKAKAAVQIAWNGMVARVAALSD